MSDAGRRTREDQANRDFTCRCGKGYLSYAAVYTHVKKKHHSQKQFVEAIVRPNRLRLKRGRPPQNRPLQTSISHLRLTIAEETIFDLYELLHGSDSFTSIILKGNAVADKEKQLQLYESLRLRLRIEEGEGAPQEIVDQLNKHFNEEIRARVRIILGIIHKGWENSHKRAIIQELNRCNLWEKSEVNQLFVQCYGKWMEASR